MYWLGSLEIRWREAAAINMVMRAKALFFY
jgi:hypothetical protein